MFPCTRCRDINVDAIHEKDDLLDSQEDFLIKENKKHVKVKNAYALEVEKCQKLSSELRRTPQTAASSLRPYEC